MESLDPRINRLKSKGEWDKDFSQRPMEQFETYEVFLQLKESRPFEHVGIMHAPGDELALVFAKEQFSRRYTCSGLFVARTDHVKVTGFTDDMQNIYENIAGDAGEEKEPFEVFHLRKRGKQHVHVGSVLAEDHEDAILHARDELNTG